MADYDYRGYRGRSPSPGCGRGGRFERSPAPPLRGPPMDDRYDRGYRGRSPDYGRKRRRDESPPRGRYDLYDRDPRDRRDYPPHDYDRGYVRYGPDPYDDPYRREGGRGGYRDDPSGPPGGYDRGPPPPLSRPPMVAPSELPYPVTFRYFHDYLKATNPPLAADPDRVQNQWRLYKSDNHKKLVASFWEDQKDKQWFREKYEPGADWEEEKKRVRAKGREGRVDGFLGLFEKGDMDGLSFDYDSAMNKKAITNDKASSDSTNVEYPADTKTEDDIKPSVTGEDTTMDEDGLDGGFASKANGANKVTDDVVIVPAPENQLFIKSIAPDISRQEMEDRFKEVEGFDYLALSDPHTGKKFHRVGWINFVPGTDMDAVGKALSETKIGNFVLHIMRAESAAYQKLRISPGITNTPERISKDLEQVRKLAGIFEAELDDTRGSAAIEAKAHALKESANGDVKITEDDKDMEDKPATEGASAADVVVEKQVLDLYLYYLRYVFHTCYYCICSCDFAEELQRRCAKHVRRTAGATSATTTEAKSSAAGGTGAKNGYGKGGKQPNEIGWARNLDEKLALWISPSDVDPREYGGERLEEEMHRVCAPMITDEGAGKFRCKACSKLFKALNFIEKHIITKHSGDVQLDSINRIKYLNNYALDPSHTPPLPLQLPEPPRAMPPAEYPPGAYQMPLYPPPTGYPPPPMAYSMPPGGPPTFPAYYMTPTPMPGYPYPPPQAYPGMAPPRGQGSGRRQRDDGEGNKRQRRDGLDAPVPTAAVVSDPRSKSVLAYNDLDTPEGDPVTLNY